MFFTIMWSKYEMVFGRNSFSNNTRVKYSKYASTVLLFKALEIKLSLRYIF